MLSLIRITHWQPRSNSLHFSIRQPNELISQEPEPARARDGFTHLWRKGRTRTATFTVSDESIAVIDRIKNYALGDVSVGAQQASGCARDKVVIELSSSRSLPWRICRSRFVAEAKGVKRAKLVASQINVQVSETSWCEKGDRCTAGLGGRAEPTSLSLINGINSFCFDQFLPHKVT